MPYARYRLTRGRGKNTCRTTQNETRPWVRRLDEPGPRTLPAKGEALSTSL